MDTDVCGRCAFYVVQPQEDAQCGHCHLRPPVLARLDDNGDPWWARPEVLAADLGCYSWIPRETDEVAVLATRMQPTIPTGDDAP